MRLPPLLLLAGSLVACGEPAGPAPSPTGNVSLDDLQIPNASTAVEGVLCAGQLSEDQMVALSEMGYRSFVSLRLADEGGAGWEEDFAAEKGLRFVRLPVAGKAGVDEDHARQLSALMDAEERPMVLYCGSSNRVGALLALEAFHVDGKSAEECMALGKSTGVTGLESLLEEKLGL